MNLSIIALSGKLFNGKVNSVMLPAALGPFQVLPNHTPTLSSLIAGKVSYRAGAALLSVEIKSGFVSIAHNQITIVCEPVA